MPFRSHIYINLLYSTGYTPMAKFNYILYLFIYYIYLLLNPTLFANNFFSVIDFKALLLVSVDLYKIHILRHLPYFCSIYFFLFGNSSKPDVGVKLLYGRIKLFQINE